MKESIVLFAHGSREPEWAQPFERIASRLRREFRVELAYLEQMRPTLDEALTSLVTEGAKRVRIVPLFLGRAAMSARTCPGSPLRRARAMPGVEIVLETTIGERAEITEAIAAVISKGISHQSR